MSRTRLKPEIRKEEILQVALDLAEKVGYEKLTRSEIATQAKVSDGLINAHWGTMAKLRRSVMRHACIQRRLKIIAQGLCAYDPIALRLPKELRDEASASMSR